LTPIKDRGCRSPQHPRIPTVLETQMKILLPVDGSDHTKRMLSYIAAHDELLGSGHEYTIFTVVTPIPAHAARFLDRSTVDGYCDEQAEQVLKPVRAFADQQHWKVRTAHTQGHAAEAIAARAANDKTDLIVMGTHGHTALGNMVLGSVANGVLARSKVPVLLIR
jgi:nucleotide-binding universal stress UspA family protein